MPSVCQSQDCGFLEFEANYESHLANYILSAKLQDKCSSFHLILSHNLSVDRVEVRDTFVLDNEEEKEFIRKLEYTDVDDLNSLDNLVLNDGLTIYYTYVSRQENIINERLRLPVVDIESLVYLEEELLILNEYYQLFSIYLSDEQIALFSSFIKPMIYDTGK